MSHEAAGSAARVTLRVGICPDFREEGWPSMDRVADTLLAHLAHDHAPEIDAALVAPSFRRRASLIAGGRSASNIDRGLNRLWDYPRHAKAIANRYDVFHIVDHSYSQLVHHLPAGRTVVTCHDLDTFRSLFDPGDEPRSAPFKAMTRHILGGLAAAARVTCDTAAVRDELVARGLVAASSVIVAPIGVDPVFAAGQDPEADAEVERLVGAAHGAVELLHVGSTVPRKRIDLLLRTVASLRATMPAVHLVRVGGAFTPAQSQLAAGLGLDGHVSILPPLNDRQLAAAYRRAALLLLPSEREGFGLPLVESMACGTPALASDLAVLRETGGGAAEHCAAGDLDAWVRRSSDLLLERSEQPARWKERAMRGVAAARRFSWSAFADTMAGVYADLARNAPRGGGAN